MSTRVRRRQAGAEGPRTLIIACGAIARDVIAVLGPLGRQAVDVECLPPELHNRPERIPQAVHEHIERARADHDRIFVAYADCGTGGLLDEVLDEAGVDRLPGAHCYEFLAGARAFASLSGEAPGTFYLTDFLARHFDRLVMDGLGIVRHPELLEAYFGNYTDLVFLSQSGSADLLERARSAAERLSLRFSHHHTGLAPLAGAMRPVLVALESTEAA